MKVKDIIRLSIWGVLSLFCFICGFVGMYNNFTKTSLTDASIEKLDTLINNFNNNTTITNYKSSSILYTAKMKKNNILINYSDNSIEKKYTLNYDETNSLLKFEFDTNDDIAWTISKIMVDSVSIALGNEETNTFETFEYLKSSGSSSSNSLKFISNENNTIMEISTVYDLNVVNINPNVIDTNTLVKNLDKLKAFNYETVNNNLILKLYKENNLSYIMISQNNKLSSDTYTNISNLIYYIYDIEELNLFQQNFTNIESEKLEFNNYKITKDKKDNLYSILIEISEKENKQVSSTNEISGV